jgi:hypothetical protein
MEFAAMAHCGPGDDRPGEPRPDEARHVEAEAIGGDSARQVRHGHEPRHHALPRRLGEGGGDAAQHLQRQQPPDAEMPRAGEQRHQPGLKGGAGLGAHGQPHAVHPVGDRAGDGADHHGGR